MEQLTEYWQKFPDGSPNRWSVESNSDSWSIRLPNAATLRIDRTAPSVNLGATYEKDDASTRLWTNSLRYLVPILDAGDTATVSAVLADFKKHVRIVADGSGEHFEGSLDHQCALQIRTICEIKSWAARTRKEAGGGELPSNADLGNMVSLVYSVVDRYDLLRPNNHGVMLAISMLHAGVIFPEVPRSVDRQSLDGFLNSTFREVLGRDGVANENTPIYQAFYINLLEQVAGFEEWAFDEVDGEISELLNQATTAYTRMLLPNKALPPLGDASYSSQSRFKPTLGTWASEENGLFIDSNERSYLSFICGYRGVFHKQLDDTSVYLWHDGNALIQDAGLCSYDSKDSIAVSIRGQLGHSGLYFTEFDSVRAQDVVSWGAATRSVKSSLSVETAETGDSILRATGTANFRGTVAKRVITKIESNRYLIRDAVRGNEAATNPISRFLLDPDASVEVRQDNSIIVRNGTSWMCLSPEGNSIDAIIVSGGSDYDRPRGWIAPKNYQLKATTVLEFPIAVNEDFEGKQLLRLSFGSEGDGAEPWIPEYALGNEAN